MFRPYRVIIRPSKKTDQRAALCFTALWDPKRLQGFVTECKIHKFVLLVHIYKLMYFTFCNKNL